MLVCLRFAVVYCCKLGIDTKMHMNSNKQFHLEKLAGATGIIGALAIDQRRSLRRMIADAANVSSEAISDEQLVLFKEAISEVLSPHATAILFDTEYGLSGAAKRDSSCGLLLAYEADGYENPRPNRMLALMKDLSVQRLADMGADGVKILLHYSPDDPVEANDEKFALIERIGAECEAVGIPFFLEPLLYDPKHPLILSTVSPDVRKQQAFEFAKRKPRMVVEMMREFSKDRYRVDILKVEFPVVAANVEGSATFSGDRAYTMQEAVQWYHEADAAAGRPYIYLSAGVSSEEFLESLRIGASAGTRYSGVLCGRATWQGGAKAFAKGGKPAFVDWLREDGVRNIMELNRLVANATPWTKFNGTHGAK